MKGISKADFDKYIAMGATSQGVNVDALPDPDSIVVHVDGETVLVPRKNKYNAKKTVVDGITFDSKAESERYKFLKSMQDAGAISNLELQPRYVFYVNSQRICAFKPDFRYVAEGEVIVEDVKSKATKTRDYSIRKKLLLALYNIDLVEIMK